MSSNLAQKLDDFAQAAAVNRNCKITVNLDRDGTRQVFTGRRYWQTSIFPSRKCGKSIVCEGQNELLFAAQCEVDIGVIEYASQAILFETRVGSKWTKYHSDFCRLRADGAIEIIEVKPDASHLDRPDYREKLEAAGEICAELGWMFTPVFGVDLQKRTFHNFHVNWAHRYRFYLIPDWLSLAVERLADACGGHSTVQDLKAICSGLEQARALLCALICRGNVHLDLSQPISLNAPIALIGGYNHGL
ncbi:MAG: TnsA endonuclease N-terminal domain-containing protein [Aquidulcibacter sp.]